MYKALSFFVQLFIIFKLNRIMETQEKFQSVLSRIDTATNGIAGQLIALKEQIRGGGLSAEVENSILGQLDSAAGKLEGIGADSTDPVPDPVIDENQPLEAKKRGKKD